MSPKIALSLALALPLLPRLAAAAPSATDVLVLPGDREVTIPGHAVENWTAPSLARSTRWPACSATSSAMTGPTAIVLHETGSMSANFTSTENKCVHFLITRTGQILQVAPLDRTWGHAPSGGHAIGIEIANGDDDPTGYRNYSSRPGKDRIKVNWSGAPYLYWLTDVQFDAVYGLVDYLTTADINNDGTAGDIPRKVANAELSTSHFFVGAQGQRVSPAVDSLLTNRWRGVLSHSINGGGVAHNDGGAPAAYTYFRFGGANHVDALCFTQRLITRARETSLAALPAEHGISAEAFAFQTWIPISLNETDESVEKCTGYQSTDPPAADPPQVDGPVLDLGGDAPPEVIDLGGE